MLYSRQSTKSTVEQTSKTRSTRPVHKNRGFIKELFAAHRPNEARSRKKKQTDWEMGKRSILEVEDIGVRASLDA